MSKKKLVAILNSRQSKTPFGGEPWLEATRRAVKYAIINDWGILTSTGMTTWEYLSWTVGVEGGFQRLVIPGVPDAGFERALLEDLALDPAKTSIHVIEDDSVEKLPAKERLSVRDRLIVDTADVILPISIRSGGNLEKLIESKEIGGGAVDRQFEIRGPSYVRRRTINYVELLQDQELRSIDGEWLIHWTRAAQGTWPGETRAEYFCDLTESPIGINPRAAYESLQRIVQEKRIRASHWKIGNKKPVVAFAALSIQDAMAGMRWRAKFQRWNYEPYGVAINLRAAVEAGCRPVRYLTTAAMRKIADEEKPFCHAQGNGSVDWRAEKEWRFLGDVELRSFAENDVRILTLTATETQQLAAKSPWNVSAILAET